MFDFKFDWCKEMEVGIGIIDAHHRELFRIGRDMEQLIMNGCRNATFDQLLDIVCELRDYVGYHFYTEENLMKEYNYPHYSEHKAAHTAFRTQVLEIDMPTLGKNPEKVLPKLKDELQNFLFNHILTEDHNLCKFLGTCGMH